MAEFQEVAKHWKRMCNKYWRSTTCHGCPIAENEKAYEACSDYDIDVGKMEELVTTWAAEHPEPVYPKWGEWLAEQGVVDINVDKGFFLIKPEICKPIPANIAEKLGIAPKEVV